MQRSPRRTDSPITVSVAVLQALRWSPATAAALIDAIETRTSGYEHVSVGLLYKALDQLIDRGLVRRAGPRQASGAVFALTAAGRRHAKAQGAAIAKLFASA